VQVLEQAGVDLLRAGYTGKSEKKEAPYPCGGHPSYGMRLPQSEQAA
jgi:hypothetical protein